MFDVNKILGTKKGKKNSSLLDTNKILGNIKSTKTKNTTNNLFNTNKILNTSSTRGASIKKQNQWKNMSMFQRNNARRMLPDRDGDRVPDMFDCQPFNSMRQDEQLNEQFQLNINENDIIGYDEVLNEPITYKIMEEKGYGIDEYSFIRSIGESNNNAEKIYKTEEQYNFVKPLDSLNINGKEFLQLRVNYNTDEQNIKMKQNALDNYYVIAFVLSNDIKLYGGFNREAAYNKYANIRNKIINSKLLNKLIYSYR